MNATPARATGAAPLVASALFLAAFSGQGCAQHRAMHSYFPLSEGNTWTYTLEGPFGDRTLRFEIDGTVEGDGGTRFLLADTKGHYYLRTERDVSVSVSPGIWTVLLSAPLRLGRRFDGGRAETMLYDSAGEEEPVVPVLPIRSSGYKVITGLDRTVTVPAGTFTGCVEVTHVAGPILGVKYFAPGVGLVLGDSWLVENGRRSRTTRQELVSYRITGGTRGGETR